MSFSLSKLPFEMDALEPHMSRETLEYHYGKHHAGYVKKLNAAVEQQSELQGRSLEELVRDSQGGVFNNAAQVWNHTFFWNCLCPGSEQTRPGEALQNALESEFGSIDAFKTAFADAAAANFGSGWTWLVLNAGDGIEILNTDDADTPIRNPRVTPLMTLDVWEHAYYIDYRNDRARFIDNFWSILDWETVSERFDTAAPHARAA